MRVWKQAVLFYIGGTAYLTMEFLWRGRSDGSMFLLGGACFLLVGGRIARLEKIPLPLRLILGAVCITALELGTGLLINGDHGIWDYRKMPLQYRGQICIGYSLLWIPVSLGAMVLYALAEEKLLAKWEKQ